jgi:hypothetical protein
MGKDVVEIVDDPARERPQHFQLLGEQEAAHGPFPLFAVADEDAVLLLEPDRPRIDFGPEGAAVKLTMTV